MSFSLGAAACDQRAAATSVRRVLVVCIGEPVTAANGEAVANETA